MIRDKSIKAICKMKSRCYLVSDSRGCLYILNYNIRKIFKVKNPSYYFHIYYSLPDKIPYYDRIVEVYNRKYKGKLDKIVEKQLREKRFK